MKPVSFIPRGSKTRFLAYSSSGCPRPSRRALRAPRTRRPNTRSARRARSRGAACISFRRSLSSSPYRAPSRRPAASPARCVRSSSIVTWSRAPPPDANSGMNFATRSWSRIFPSSTSVMTLVAVATTFVSDAMSKTVSTVIGSTAGATARLPYAFRKTTLPWRPTRTTAPGHSFFAMDSVIAESRFARRAADMSRRRGRRRAAEAQLQRRAGRARETCSASLGRPGVDLKQSHHGMRPVPRSGSCATTRTDSRACVPGRARGISAFERLQLRFWRARGKQPVS